MLTLLLLLVESIVINSVKMKPFSQCLLNNNQVYNIIFKIHNRDSRSVTISSSVTVSPSCNGSASNGMFYQFLLCQFLIILNSCSVVAV